MIQGRKKHSEGKNKGIIFNGQGDGKGIIKVQHIGVIPDQGEGVTVREDGGQGVREWSQGL